MLSSASWWWMREYVQQQVAEIVKNQDLSRYIL